jgi:hypothetical protein
MTNDIQDFLSEMESHQYDNSDTLPLKAEDLADGEYIVQIKSARPRKVDSLNCWCWDWVMQIHSGPSCAGKSVTYGNLLGSDAAKNRLGMELERVGFTGKDFTDMLNNAIANLPNRWAKVAKKANNAKNGKIYHNIYLSELLDPKEAKKLAASKPKPVSQPDEDMPF